MSVIHNLVELFTLLVNLSFKSKNNRMENVSDMRLKNHTLLCIPITIIYELIQYLSPEPT